MNTFLIVFKHLKKGAVHLIGAVCGLKEQCGIMGNLPVHFVSELDEKMRC